VSTWIVAWFVVALLSTLAIGACLVALTRHVFLLGRTARAMQEELQPILDEVGAEGGRAAERAASIRAPGTGAYRP
jgi:hypothetical protein